MGNDSTTLLWVITGILLISLGILFALIKSEGNECLANPVVYGINQISGDAKCSCVTRDMRYFNINNTDVWWVENKNNIPVILHGEEN